MIELSPRYNSKEVENKWYSLWESSGFFAPQIDPKQKPFTIVIPPPNVTGILHMGHALNNTIQDILIRWKRMQGVPTLWVPGVDHAGIATQNVVEKKLAKEKKTRHSLGRENFVKEVWRWKEEYGSTIVKQLRRLGASSDWSRERFTMDEGLSRAVREAFVTLYERGLIYQGNYIINWCPRCQTALSDEESAHQEIKGILYTIKYPIAGKGKKAEKISEDHIAVATTRPETMLGDTAVAVHPGDERYKHLIGKKVVLPLMEREIPVIGDEFVDPEFGTGIVKVTPAHDPNDFEMGKRHNLKFINVMNPGATINEHGGVYQGLDRFEARKRIIQDLEHQNLFVRSDSHLHAVGHCYRCHTVIEPYLSKQWFVKMQPLAEKALKAQSAGAIKFYPERWTKVYVNWLENIRDWCISRQIWWGHQIPVWYCEKCRSKQDVILSPSDVILSGVTSSRVNSAKNLGDPSASPQDDTARSGVIVSRQTPSKCPKCGNTKLEQDPDVLDTWFSSWLWPFSTLGWPPSPQPSPPKGGEGDVRSSHLPRKGAASLNVSYERKGEGVISDLQYFYPTSVLVTAQEILFFWVARMVMAGLEFMGEVPFHSVVIHGTVRVEDGQKMSKSLGNIIDPIEIIDEMGADALRFAMMMLAATDVYLSREKFELGRNFTNKIWNATRFILTNLEGYEFPSPLPAGRQASPLPLKGGEGRAREVYDLPHLSSVDKWILAELDDAVREVGKSLGEFRFYDAANTLYHFFWHSLCDWYLELVKPVLLKGTKEERKRVQSILVFLLETSMRLLHPFMPFITEEIWQLLSVILNPSRVMLSEAKHLRVNSAKNLRDPSASPQDDKKTIMLAKWPEPLRQKRFETEAKQVGLFQEAVAGIRDLRSRLDLPPAKNLSEVEIIPKSNEAGNLLKDFVSHLMHLCRVEKVNVGTKKIKKSGTISRVYPQMEIFVSGLSEESLKQEADRTRKRIEEVEGVLRSLEARLTNSDFVAKAPEEVIEKEEKRRTELKNKLKAYQENLEMFQ